MAAFEINFRILNKLLGLEFQGIGPVLGIPLNGVAVDKELGVGGQTVALDLGWLESHVGNC